MQNSCTNIYQNARKIAGLTQERAAELMGCTTDVLILGSEPEDGDSA